ncbi:response regulator [Cohnella sp. GCM10012308]|uniref:response regulator n=1 Tax=Cohnella sp. GCM10012308 TaxID=3317329 RepID=UPI00360B595E
MYRAIIVEDEKPVLELMKVIIGRNGNYEIVGTFGSPLEALEQLPGLMPDVAFIDVEMPKMNGLELAQRIMDTSKRTAIVFSTAYKQYALSAFDVQALDYVLKPVTPAAIERVTSRLRERLPAAAPSGKPDALPMIRCLGGFEIRNSAGALVRCPTRKAEELLAYLLCHAGTDVSKWQLTELLWPEMSEERAMPNLHTAIYLLKKMVKENGLPLDILKTTEGYTLEANGEPYDQLTYRIYASSNASGTLSPEQAEQLRAAYRGPLLDGKPYLWKIGQEQALEKQYTGIVRRLVREDLEQRNWERAVSRLEAYLSIYPVSEEMNDSLVELYASLGRTEKAARQYASFEQKYMEEFGCLPAAGRSK